MSEKTLFLKDLDGIIVAAYERQEFDEYRDIIYKYEIVVKGFARVGHTLHYLLCVDKHLLGKCPGKARQDEAAVKRLLQESIVNGINKINVIKEKLEQDSVKLNKLLNEVNLKGVNLKGDYYG